VTTYIEAALDEAATVLAMLRNNSQTIETIQNAASIMGRTFINSGTVFSCGNGGSMCDAMHFAEELSGRFRKDRRALAAIAISDPGHITCAANDFGYENAFSRFLESHARPGDTLLAISTSGASRNVINAAKTAKEKGATVVSLTGHNSSELGFLVDFDICTPAGDYSDRVQELHIKVIHILIELVERTLFPENY